MSTDIKITAESLTSPAAQFSIQRNGETVSSGTNVGVHVALFNAVNGQVITTQSFNTNETRETIELEACLKNAPIGSIIAITTCGNVELSNEIKRICTTVGSHLVHSFSPGKNWALVGIKGTAPALAHETLESGNSTVTATLPLQSEESSNAIITVKSAGYLAGDTAEVVVAGRTVPMISANGIHRGLFVAVIDEDNFDVLTAKVFDTYSSTKNSEKFANLIKSLPLGRIVVVAVKDEATGHLTSAAKDACASIGSKRVYDLSYRSSWAIIGYKGARVGTVVEGTVQ